MENRQGSADVVKTARERAEALEECPMNYVNPYVNQMLKKHPLGKEFRIIRELILHYKEGPGWILLSLNNGIDYQGPYKGTYQGPYWKFYSNKFLRIIVSFFTSRYRESTSNGREGRRCAEEATKRAEILLKYLDQSKDSQWIVTYMLEDPLRRVTARCNISPEESSYYPVINMFESYLKDCPQ